MFQFVCSYSNQAVKDGHHTVYDERCEAFFFVDSCSAVWCLPNKKEGKFVGVSFLFFSVASSFSSFFSSFFNLFSFSLFASHVEVMKF